MNINEQVGKNIKKYRLAYKLTLEELASLIHKSKSTMSKYEKGIISLDVTTLEEIAKVLKISTAQLLAVPADNLQTMMEHKKGEFVDKQYMYSYDGRSKRIFKSVLERYRMEDDPAKLEINLFYDVQDIMNWGDCKALYAGYLKRYEFIENYTLQNQNNPTERVLINCINSLGRTHKKIGLLSGLSYKTMLPVSMKIMMSAAVLKEDQELISSLQLTKEDIRISKKYNLFTIDQFFE